VDIELVIKITRGKFRMSLNNKIKIQIIITTTTTTTTTIIIIIIIIL
jgi:hypothetical protein